MARLWRSTRALFESIAVPLLLAVVAGGWILFALYGGPTLYSGGDELGPLKRWPDRYRAAWSAPVPVEPRVKSVSGDLRVGDKRSEDRLNRAADEIDPSLSPGADRLLFASNRSGGLGGFDLYIAARQGMGFGDPLPLPAPLSTLFQERSPSLALLPDGSARLLFTSNRLHGLATDFDLYIARRDVDGTWQHPELLVDLSTVADERGATLHPEGDAIVFSRPEIAGIEYFESFLRADGSWSPPRRLRGLSSPDNRPVVRYDEGGNGLLIQRGDDWYRTRLRILRELPTGGTPWGAWILLALALLLLILRALASRWSGLEILYRCLLISILVHLFLWWWLQDRGLEAPDPTDPGPPAEEVAPIELDPQLFTKATERAPSQMARAEVIPVEAAQAQTRRSEPRMVEREALAMETSETTPEARESEAPERLERSEQPPTPTELPSRSSTAVDAAEFALQSDPGRSPAQVSAEEPTPAEAAESSSARATSAPSVTRSVALAAPSSETPDLPAQESTPARTRSAELAQLSAPTRAVSSERNTPQLKEATMMREPTPAERVAALAPVDGDRRPNPDQPTPRPTRVRPGPSELTQPAAELARIDGAESAARPGGATQPTRRRDRLEPNRAATGASTSADSSALAESPVAPPEVTERGLAGATAPAASTPASTPSRPSPRPGRGTARSAEAAEPGAAELAGIRGAASGESPRRRRASGGAAPLTPTTANARGARAGESGVAGDLAAAASNRTSAMREATVGESSLSPLAPRGRSSGDAASPLARTRGRESSALSPPTSVSGGPSLTGRAAVLPRPRRDRDPTAVLPERNRPLDPRRAVGNEPSLDQPEREVASARVAPLREAKIEELALPPLPPREGEPVVSSVVAASSSTVSEPRVAIASIVARLDAPTRPIARADVEREAETWVPWVSARRGPAKEEALARGGGNAETEAAVRAGLEYLASRQRSHGGWGNARHRHDKYGETSIGRTALALLAFLGAGHSPTSGTEYSALTAEAMEYLISAQDERTGHFGSRTSAYSHAIATYALGEAVLMGAGRPIRQAMLRGVEQILRNQQLDRRRPDYYGGWAYFYANGRQFDEYPRVSITVWQLMALETALLAGADLPDGRIDAGKDWILSMWSNRLGKFYYNREPRRLARQHKTLPASTPAAAFILQVLGHDRNDRRLVDALAMTADRAPTGWRESSTDDFLENGAGNSYFWYYGTLALFLRGGEAWQGWNAALQQSLLPSQRSDGSWVPICPYAQYAGDSNNDRIYTTALNVLTLEVYYRYLTPFQKRAADEQER